jgi:hypothetical protein
MDKVLEGYYDLFGIPQSTVMIDIERPTELVHHVATGGVYFGGARAIPVRRKGGLLIVHINEDYYLPSRRLEE